MQHARPSGSGSNGKARRWQSCVHCLRPADMKRLRKVVRSDDVQKRICAGRRKCNRHLKTARSTRHTRRITMDQAGEVHDGGCLCGAVRHQTVGVPRWQAACHCRFCQRLTASVLNAEVVFPKDHVLFSGDKPKVYAYRSPDQGRMLNVQFCTECSVTVGLTFERFPLVQAMLSGTYDDPRWIQMDKHICSAYAVPWMAYSEATDVYSEHQLKLDGSLEHRYASARAQACSRARQGRLRVLPRLKQSPEAWADSRCRRDTSSSQRNHRALTIRRERTRQQIREQRLRGDTLRTRCWR